MPKKKRKAKNKQKSKNLFIKNEFFILLSIAVISILIWDTLLIYPIKLLVVTLHEISHALVTIFTGGSVIKMVVTPQLSGGVTSEGGNNFLIASAGYLGSLIFGTFIFLSASNKKLNLWSSTTIAVLILLFTANFFSNAVTIIFSLFYVGLFYAAPRYFPEKINYWTMRTIGLISMMYVLFDIKEDLLTLTYRKTDSQQLAIITTVPSIVWAIIWFSVTLFTIFFVIKFSYFNEKK